MSRTLTIQNVPYTYPEAGETPGWGEAATDWAQAVTDAVNGIVGAGDILPTLATIANNQTIFTSVTGLIFNTTNVKAAHIEYMVFRSTNSTELDEIGSLSAIYNTSTTSWELGRRSTGDAGIEFSITSGGQIQYKSSNIAGTSYSGRIRFRARTLAP